MELVLIIVLFVVAGIALAVVGRRKRRQAIGPHPNDGRDTGEGVRQSGAGSGPGGRVI